MIGGTIALACLGLVTPAIVVQFVAPDPSNPIHRDLYLNGVGRWSRLRLALLTVISAAVIAIATGVVCGAAAGVGDAISNHGRTSVAQISPTVIGLVLVANVWQVVFFAGLALGERWRERAILMIGLLPIPIGVGLHWLPSGLGSRVASLTPAGTVFAWLFTVNGERRFQTTATHDSIVLMAWMLVPWLLVAARTCSRPLRRKSGRV